MSGWLFRISEYCCSLRRNLFTALLMTLMAIVLLISGSLILREWKMYAPYADFAGRQGFVYYGEDWSSLTSYGAQTYDTYRTSLNRNKTTLSNSVYPDWVLEGWSPRLESGSWLDAGSDENEIVIGGLTGSLRVGDEVALSCVTSGGESVEITFRVVGILAENTKLLNGADSYSADDKGYNKCYNNGDSLETGLYVIMSQRTADRLNLFQRTAGWHVAVLSEELGAEEYQELYESVQRQTGYTAYTLEEFCEESKSLIRAQIKTYVPILLFGVLLVLTGVYAAAHINLKMGMKHHTIFLLVGATPMQRLRLLLTDVFVNTGLSVLFFVLICFLIERSGMRGQLVIDYCWQIYVAEVIYYAVNVAVSVLFYILAWKNISPKEALLAQKT